MPGTWLSTRRFEPIARRMFSVIETPSRGLMHCRRAPLPAVEVNPVHVDDLTQLHTQIARVCTELGWAPPLWLETTVEDPGGGQASSALAAGAEWCWPA